MRTILRIPKKGQQKTRHCHYLLFQSEGDRRERQQDASLTREVRASPSTSLKIAHLNYLHYNLLPAVIGDYACISTLLSKHYILHYLSGEAKIFPASSCLPIAGFESLILKSVL